MTNFKKVNPKQSFPKLEEEILGFWRENNTFEKSIETRKNSEEFNFYDWPPFATGTPHYGHILAWTIKDVIPRYQTMLWKRVDRAFGWDCHGLPIENIVEKKMWINGKEDIECKVWIFDFNENCRANVFGYVDEWKKTVERMWRWVNMEDDYKTMDVSFMESVWWAFKNIYDKWLIYEGHRVVPYCPRCTTPLSNFEVNQGYKDKQSKTVVVKFKVKWNENKYILAWTTTPWTLYSNLWLAVWKDIDYVELLDKTNWDTYILAKEKIKDFYKSALNTGVDSTPVLDTDEYQIIREYCWECLVWIKYEPVFTDFQIQIEEMWKNLWTEIKLWKNAWTVQIWHHVSIETWTWIVHLAPAYGEDDYLIWQKTDLGFVAHIDNTWKTYNLLENNWKFVFDFNEMVIEELKAKKLSVNVWTIMHSYPHCWRCDTPLIYRAISAWYVAVEKFRDRMVENNKKITWVPEAIKYGRFGNWIEQARDWNISRNRYWGSAIPVWQSEDKKEEVCVWSIEELYELNKDFGQIEKKDEKYFYKATWKEIDLHKHFVDDIFVINKNNFKAKKVLGIHWWTSSWIQKWYAGKWLPMQDKMKNVWIVFDVPDFDKSKETSYKKWKEKLDTLNLDEYDTIIATSFWCPVIMQYLCEKNIKIPRLILVAPSWLKWNEYLEKIIPEMTEDATKLKSLVKEIIITHSKDDDSNSAPFSYWESLSKKLWSTFLPVDWVWHNFWWWSIDLLCSLIKNWSPLKRIPEVLDCWFESWAMPYASKHYPFKNENNFKFPADFIAEWLDQTRGWFYTLLVLWTALFDNTPFLNCIVNGVVLAEDGKKMSKSLKNYPAPELIFDKYWADAMRFYLMNSPVVEAQDFRFAENWVEEVVKKVILPLWNTYSFFTTYANIDNYKAKKWSIYFCRHGQTTNNEVQLKNWWDVMMSWWDSEAMLTEKWKKQARETWISFNYSGEKIDLIISSPRLRTQDTAKIIANEIWYNGEIIIDERFNEIREWVFLNMTHSEIQAYAKKEYNLDLKPWFETRKFFKDGKYNKVEDVADFDKRVVEAYSEIEKKYKWKNVLIIAHTGVFRPINRYINNLDFDDAHYKLWSIRNATIFKMPNQRHNVLDKWIISELNKLILDVKTGLDNYRINEATRSIMPFMDNLTNWYIRRSRKRFWLEWMPLDKQEAYDTLYEILVELCKIFAPFMPFVSEYIYKNLTWKESVHLDSFPNVNKSFILNNLNTSFDKTAKLVNLWLAFRARHKIRVRQVLKSATIWEKLEDYYIEILKEELNVKEIIVLDNPSKIAKKVCRPNAKLIWPKYWKDVQKIITEAKNGNFEELKDWRVFVKIDDKNHPNPLSKEGIEQNWVILEVNEYEIAYEKLDESMDIEAWFGMVIALDPTLNEALLQEWYSRDLVRFIQESRKEALFEVSDRIELELRTENWELKKSIEKFRNYIQDETLSTIVEKVDNPDFEKEIMIDEYKIEIVLKKYWHN